MLTRQSRRTRDLQLPHELTKICCVAPNSYHHNTDFRLTRSPHIAVLHVCSHNSFSSTWFFPYTSCCDEVTCKEPQYSCCAAPSPLNWFQSSSFGTWKFGKRACQICSHASGDPISTASFLRSAVAPSILWLENVSMQTTDFLEDNQNKQQTSTQQNKRRAYSYQASGMLSSLPFEVSKLQQTTRPFRPVLSPVHKALRKLRQTKSR